MLRDIIDQAPSEDKAAISEAVAKVREVLAPYGDNGKMALTLLAAEFAAEE